ncbi:sugar transferase [Riemerella columbipharyngis]|uniref:Sugar transferase involved in LPS biosynthesis (Colanic, teichoic acid) n=1 Tax=Riemerella columbipharyngis TaxID=1071918 RepID=A0A1G6YWA7_9FLAO|nr:sugar transferase [Riemerella columbipharyngis]SDD94784.1 Sugar transferase involved in LPS biosynthesis (colanic, teichoic acid) [Riemerella columbipharyngis]
MKRIFDFIFSFIGLLVISPVLLGIALIIAFTSKGGVFYRQNRVGRFGRDFRIFKFRTMYVDSDKKGLLTVGGRDPRVTNVGYYLRKYKIDELPQLINVFLGDMSFVGPRPEVRKYVDLYNDEQRKVLNVRPGITDLASIEYRNENEILSKQSEPEKYYIDVIMPAKLSINLKYIENRSLFKDINVILKTLKAILV